MQLDPRRTWKSAYYMAVAEDGTALPLDEAGKICTDLSPMCTNILVRICSTISEQLRRGSTSTQKRSKGSFGECRRQSV